MNIDNLGGDTTDEFRIDATDVSGAPVRRWTRNSFDVSTFIADQAVERLGFVRAEVRNQFQGDISDVLYEVTLNPPSKKHFRDAYRKRGSRT